MNTPIDTDLRWAFEHYRLRTGLIAEPRAALFDMDGTLYDSMPGHAKAWLTMLDELGIQSTETEILMAEGRTGRDTIKMLYDKYLHRDATDDDCRRLYARKSELFAALPPVNVMPGAQQLVSQMIADGLTTVLVTGSGQNTLLNRLPQDFGDAFPADRRVTAHNVEHGKPHPEPFLRGMQLAGVEPRQAIAFDNAPLGVESASRAGALTVGIVTGNIPVEALVEAGADIVYTSMPECARLLNLRAALDV